MHALFPKLMTLDLKRVEHLSEGKNVAYHFSKQQMLPAMKHQPPQPLLVVQPKGGSGWETQGIGPGDEDVQRVKEFNESTRLHLSIYRKV